MRDLERGLGIHRAKGQHHLECVQGQIRWLEAEAHAADVDDSVLDAFEHFGDLDDGARVPLDKIDGVIGAFLNPLLQLGLEVVDHQPNINDTRRVARTDAKRDVLGLGSCARKRQGRGRDGGLQ